MKKCLRMSFIGDCSVSLSPIYMLHLYLNYRTRLYRTSVFSKSPIIMTRDLDWWHRRFKSRFKLMCMSTVQCQQRCHVAMVTSSIWWLQLGLTETRFVTSSGGDWSRGVCSVTNIFDRWERCAVKQYCTPISTQRYIYTASMHAVMLSCARGRLMRRCVYICTSESELNAQFGHTVGRRPYRFRIWEVLTESWECEMCTYRMSRDLCLFIRRGKCPLYSSRMRQYAHIKFILTAPEWTPNSKQYTLGGGIKWEMKGWLCTVRRWIELNLMLFSWSNTFCGDAIQIIVRL